MNKQSKKTSQLTPKPIRRQSGKMGYIIFWLLGVPLPILFIIYLLRGCT